MGILQVPIFKYNEWCRTTAANLAPRGTTALHTEAPRILLLYACVVPIASSHDGTKQTRYTGHIPGLLHVFLLSNCTIIGLECFLFREWDN